MYNHQGTNSRTYPSELSFKSRTKLMLLYQLSKVPLTPTSGFTHRRYIQKDTCIKIWLWLVQDLEVTSGSRWDDQWSWESWTIVFSVLGAQEEDMIPLKTTVNISQLIFLTISKCRLWIFRWRKFHKLSIQIQYSWSFPAPNRRIIYSISSYPRAHLNTGKIKFWLKICGKNTFTSRVFKTYTWR